MENIISLVECERKAQRGDPAWTKFIAILPSGPRNCQWLDAHFGFLRVEGVTDEKSFVTTDQLQEAVGGRIMCLPNPDVASYDQ